MADVTIERSALGRVAHVGDLYDAYSECFTGVSILKKDPPKATIRITDNHSSNIQFVLSDSFTDKSDKLNIEAELKVSLLSGLIQLGGSGKYLRDEKRSARAVRSSLIYNVQTKVEHINLFHDDLKGCFALDALKSSQATHVVVEVRWGANSMVTMEYANEDNHDVNEIIGDLNAELNKLVASVKGKAIVDYSKTSDSFNKSYSLHTFADILPTGELLQTYEGALEMMKKMPECLAASNAGKGKPLSFMLLPLADLNDYLKLANLADKTLKTIDEHSIIRIVKLFGEFSQVKQNFHDLSEDMKKHDSCISENSSSSISENIMYLNSNEAELKSKFAKLLISVRCGKIGTEQLECLRNEFEAGPFSLQYFARELENYSKVKEKMAFFDLLTKEGVAFVGRGSSFETLQMIHRNKNVYILFYSESAKQTDSRWSDHINTLLSLVSDVRNNKPDNEVTNSAYPDSFFIVVDTDLRPELKLDKDEEHPLYLCLYRNGNYVDKDVVKTNMANQHLGFVNSTKMPQAVEVPPNNRVVVEMCCPGSLSGTCPNTKIAWHCNKCTELVEYGFDNYFYCKCFGNARRLYSDYLFRCNNPKHGLKFLAFEQDVFEMNLNKLKPIEECINVLILGETGVGKSTWVNGIANYMTFSSLEEAKENEPISLTGASFTVMDDNFEEKIITIGDTSNEDLKTGQSATQAPKAYVFQWNDRMVRLIDTPGIGDTRGINQDKVNFDAILRFVSELQELHGICILLKPNNARLGVMFKFCIEELLTHLHRSCSQNIVFCFTNARNTFYKPGDTFPALKKLFSEKQDVNIALSNHTVYCMDNESFRFLSMMHNGITAKEEEFQLYSTSWDRSVSETNRLLTHVSSLKPHSIQDTISLNDTRRLIVSMTKPLADISQNIQANIAVIDDKVNEIECSSESMKYLQKKLYMPAINLVAVPLSYPKTVCTSQTCVEYHSIQNTTLNNIEYITVCHSACSVGGILPESFPNAALKGCAAMNSNHRCTVCRCSWDTHMHITYEQRRESCQVLDNFVDAQIKSKQTDTEKVESFIQQMIARQESLQAEQNTIRSACVKFGTFLANNAMLPYSDALREYLEVLIKQEKDKCMSGGDKKTLEGLEKMLQEYSEEVMTLRASMVSGGDTKCLSTVEIKRIIEELYNLPLTGSALKQHVKVATASRSRMISLNQIYYHPPTKSKKKKLVINKSHKSIWSWRPW